MRLPQICCFTLAMGLFVRAEKPQNCEDIQLAASRQFKPFKSEVYEIYPAKNEDRKIEVLCDMHTSGGGWTVIQFRAPNDTTDFYRSWKDYENGFGSRNGSHWIGLDAISKLTKSDNYVLRIEMFDSAGGHRFAEYGVFRVANSSDMYRLTVDNYSGDAGDSMEYHNGNRFSTKDVDNDENDDKNCAKIHQGAWWFGSCYSSNLNGVYGVNDTRSIAWEQWKGEQSGLGAVVMMIRSSCHAKVVEVLNDCVLRKTHLQMLSEYIVNLIFPDK